MKNSGKKPAAGRIPDIEVIDLNKPGTAAHLPDEPSEAPFDPEEPVREPENFFFRVNWHLVFAAAAVLIIGLIAWRITHFGVRIDTDDYEGGTGLTDTMDYFAPARLPQGAENPADDGVTTIVLLGNAPFADDRDSEDGLANMIREMSGATVYNCAVENSYLAIQNATALAYSPEDAFNFYWLTAAFCARNMDGTYQELFESAGELISDADRDIYDSLMAIDFNTVDVIAIMYDGSDYLAGHPMYNDNNASDISQFTGNMEAGIDMIQGAYPHIRIIVMSPPYAYAVNKKGEYVSSETYRYGWSTLSTYVVKQFESAYTQGVTFVDNLYGTITESNAEDYLSDNLHLNTAGRKLVAERFVYALNYFDSAEE